VPTQLLYVSARDASLRWHDGIFHRLLHEDARGNQVFR
jgi:hypothetical protein